MAKLIGYGCSLGVDPAGGSSYTTLGVVEGITGPEATRTDIDTTLLADQIMTYQPGQIDPGNVTFSVAYDTADTTTTQTLVNLLYQQSPIPNWQITFSVSSTTVTPGTETFSGYVNKIGREIVKDGMITSEVQVKVTGSPGFST